MDSVSNLWHEASTLRLPRSSFTNLWQEAFNLPTRSRSFLSSPKRKWGFFCLIAAFFLFVVYLSSPSRVIEKPRPRPYHRLPPPSSAYPWAEYVQRHPAADIRPLPSEKPLHVPTIQHQFKYEWPSAKKQRKQRQAAVKDCFARSWQAYKEHAWLEDELHPISGGTGNPFGGWAASLVDALDTLWIMDMHAQFDEAVSAIAHKDFSRSRGDTISVFETTIRYLGGFLGAYDISGGNNNVLLSKAQEFGDLLYAAFDTPNRMPQGFFKWKEAIDGHEIQAGNGAALADLASLSLEFTRLSQLTGDSKYYDAIARITDALDQAQGGTNLPGMWPSVIDAAGLGFYADGFSLGALSDSAYEYLPKEYLLLGDPEHAIQYQRMYEGAIKTIKEHVLWQPMTPNNTDILFSGNVHAYGGQVSLDPEVQHLACFVGGMVEIAAKIFERPEDLDTARKLTDGCIWAYNNMPTNIMPERTHMVPCPRTGDCVWDEAKWRSASSRDDFPGTTDIHDARYILRPEAIESVFIHYRISGDTAYQDQAWAMFEAIDHYTRTDIANAALEDVSVLPPPKKDKMESFWMAETLKYFYLIFGEPDLVSLDEYVLNTEAHPFRRPK